MKNFQFNWYGPGWYYIGYRKPYDVHIVIGRLADESSTKEDAYNFVKNIPNFGIFGHLKEPQDFVKFLDKIKEYEHALPITPTTTVI